MTEHRLKSWPEYFAPVACGLKTFELRKNDRNFQVGDVLVLQEWRPTSIDAAIGEYTGQECRRRICYLLDGLGNVGVIGPLKGLSRGYCILGLMGTSDG